MTSLAALIVKATLIFAIGWSIDRVARRRSAAVRHALWVAACAGAIVLPAAQMAMPAWPIAVLPAAPPMAVQATPRVVASAPRLTPVPDGPSVGTIDRSLIPATSQANARIAIASTWTATDVFVVIWILGAGFVVASQFVGYRRARAAVRGAAPVENAELLELATNLAATCGVRRRVQFLCGQAGSMPIAWGIARPAVVLPREANEWCSTNPARLNVVLLHELAHIARLDALTSFVVRAAVAVWWFHPLAWLASRRARLGRELATDDIVLNAGARPSDYAADLVALANLTPVSALSMARPSQLRARVQAILAAGGDRGRVSIASLLVASAIVGAAVPLAVVTLVARGLQAATISAPAPELVEVKAESPFPRPTLQELMNLDVSRPPRESVIPQPKPSFAGFWVPDDIKATQERFNAGVSWIPTGGLTISHDAKKITIAANVSNEVAAAMELLGTNFERLQTFDLDGTPSSATRPDGSLTFVHRARWDGDALVTTRLVGSDAWPATYSMVDDRLKVEFGVNTYLMHRGSVGATTLSEMFSGALFDALQAAKASATSGPSGLWILRQDLRTQPVILDLSVTGTSVNGGLTGLGLPRHAVKGFVERGTAVVFERDTPRSEAEVRSVYRLISSGGDTMRGEVTAYVPTDQGVVAKVWQLTATRLRTTVAPQVIIPKSVAEAEVEGASYPRASGSDSTPRTCTDADLHSAREQTSGDFRVDRFPVRSLFVNFVDPSRPAIDMNWTPQSRGEAAPGSFSLRGHRLDTPDEDVVWEAETIDGVNGRVFKTGSYLPNGRWLVVGTAGPNWGCFVFTKTR